MELTGLNGRTVTDAKENMCKIQNFYDELYKSSVEGNINSFSLSHNHNIFSVMWKTFLPLWLFLKRFCT